MYLITVLKDGEYLLRQSTGNATTAKSLRPMLEKRGELSLGFDGQLEHLVVDYFHWSTDSTDIAHAKYNSKMDELC